MAVFRSLEVKPQVLELPFKSSLPCIYEIPMHLTGFLSCENTCPLLDGAPAPLCLSSLLCHEGEHRWALASPAAQKRG